MPASVGDCEHGLYIKMLPEGEKHMNKMIMTAKDSNLFKIPTFLFRFNHSFFLLCEDDSQYWLILQVVKFSKNIFSSMLQNIWLSLPYLNGKVMFIKAIFAEAIQTHLQSWGCNFGGQNKFAFAGLTCQQGP